MNLWIGFVWKKLIVWECDRLVLVKWHLLWRLINEQWLILICINDLLKNLRTFSLLIFKLFWHIFPLSQKPFRNPSYLTLYWIHRTSLLCLSGQDRLLLSNHCQVIFSKICHELWRICNISILNLSRVFFALDSLYKMTELTGCVLLGRK